MLLPKFMAMANSSSHQDEERRAQRGVRSSTNTPLGNSPLTYKLGKYSQVDNRRYLLLKNSFVGCLGLLY